MDKVSSLIEKSEYKKVKEDYNNNFGFNIGINSFKSKTQNDKIDNFVKGEINIKKR